MAAGTILGRAVVVKAQRVLNDLNAGNWPLDEVVDWLNEGQRRITLLRPDASSELKEMDLVAGTLQSVPAGTVRILDVTRNVGGRAITYIKRADLDAFDAGWHTGAANVIVKHWASDERLPERFWCYPPQPASPGQIEILRSVLPANVTLDGVNGESVDSVIGISDIYEGPLIDFTVYRSFTKDATYTVRGGKADMAWNHFLQSLGIQLTTDRRWSSEVNTPPHQTAQQRLNTGAFQP